MDIGESAFEEFKKIVADFHGFPAPGIFIGGYMVELAKSRLPEGTLFEAVVETTKCLPDAVQLLTLCSTGNQWMKVINLGRYAVSLYDKYTGHGYRVWLDLDLMTAWPEITSWFLKEKPKAEQDSAKLIAEIEQAGDGYCQVGPIVINKRFLRKAHMGEITVCPICKEAYPRNDGAICRGCQGEAPYSRVQQLFQSAKEDNLHPRSVPVEEAVGQQALHDMTRIDPGRFKGPEIKAGEEIGAGDVCRLQQMGRSSVYVRDENQAGSGEWVHENDAVLALAERMAGSGVSFQTPPVEGKISLLAEHDGLLSLDVARLEAFNLVPDVMCASRQNHLFVEKGKPFAGCRAIPLYISRQNLGRALAVLNTEPLFEIRELRRAGIGVLVTGTEVFQGLIQDKFIPVIQEKVSHFGCRIVHSDIVPDDHQAIAGSVHKMLAKGAELIITTAGLSVDPDDVTRQGLLKAGMTDILYGAPVLPGAMTLLGRINGAKILGVPACALFFKTTSLDLLLPMLLAEVAITRKDLARMAEGGFCLNCKSCTFPKCPFGK